ncbi:carboxypeptidase M32 [Rubrobacter taiwanensis]|jgi:carboxypeptidase Taq|uniref:Metal-dependent carboxypeptidase n=1 Tax=Rubrobacter taiwanensis TaxID=185139 RepID=A0A4R1BTD0_9ACTN|nr:carboxypeptidase M32 [Rubrobacter taiwanensis]TCJ20536.1 carboxypeptidase M32 [Rubrobacter taiwanensis]
MRAYERLEKRFERLGNLYGALSLLHWDTQTMMPRGGAGARGEQLAALSVVCHELLTDPEVEKLLDEAEREGGLNEWQAANLREMRRSWVHAGALDAELISEFSRARSACEMVWREARPANDFAAVRPGLERVLELVREAGRAKAEKLGIPPYDALLDEYEPGGSSEKIDRLFDDFAAFLPDFLEEVLARQEREPEIPPLGGPFDESSQRQIALKMMETLGFDFDHGRLDTSLHAFCMGMPQDVRVTTRYDENDPMKSLLTVLHETGHALYEQGLPRRWRLQPVGQSCSTSLHESQSLLVEKQAGHSPEFFRFAAPVMREIFGSSGAAWEPENLYRRCTRVERSLIRIDADEVTYPAHVILRYRLEKAMVEGGLEVKDLPGAWNEGMRELIGVVPPDDRDGCLQDIHWYEGLFAYFPTYTLGAMSAAQLFDAARREEPEIMSGIERGDFAPLLDWLRKNVHEKGALRSPDELISEATGRPLDSEVFKRHLKARYLSG